MSYETFYALQWSNHLGGQRAGPIVVHVIGNYEENLILDENNCSEPCDFHKAVKDSIVVFNLNGSSLESYFPIRISELSAFCCQ